MNTPNSALGDLTNGLGAARDALQLTRHERASLSLRSWRAASACGRPLKRDVKGRIGAPVRTPRTPHWLLRPLAAVLTLCLLGAAANYYMELGWFGSRGKLVVSVTLLLTCIHHRDFSTYAALEAMNRLLHLQRYCDDHASHATSNQALQAPPRHCLRMPKLSSLEELARRA